MVKGKHAVVTGGIQSQYSYVDCVCIAACRRRNHVFGAQRADSGHQHHVARVLTSQDKHIGGQDAKKTIADKARTSTLVDSTHVRINTERGMLTLETVASIVGGQVNRTAVSHSGA
jgi:hypothetical protein